MKRIKSLVAEFPRSIPLLLLTGLAALAPINSPAAIPPAEKLLPDDTLVVVTAPDFARLREITAAAPQSRLWNDPSMKPFRDKVTAKWNEDLVEPLERELGVRLSDYTSLPQGQVTFALTRAEGSPTETAFLLLIDTRESSGQLKTNLATLKSKWIESGKTIKTDKVRDIEFSTLRLTGADLPDSLKKLTSSDDDESDMESEEGQDESEEPSELIFGQHESLLIVGSSMRSIERVAARLTGGSVPPLGELATFQSSYGSTFRDAPLYAWVNAKLLLNLMTQASSEEAEENPMEALFNVQKIATALGLNGLQAAAFSLQSSPEGSSGQFVLTIPETSREGLFKLFPSGGRESTPPAFVPADAVKFQRIRIDGQKAWTTILSILGQISPDATGTIDFLIEQANEAARIKDPNFDLRKSFFGNLGDDVIAYEKAPTGETLAELNAAPSLFLIGSPQPQQLAAGLKAVLALVSQQATPKERDFLGRTIYSVPAPATPFAAAGGGASATLHYSPSGGYLAISTDVSLLEEFLRSGDGEQKQLREKSGLSGAIARVGGGSTGWLTYEDQSETTRVALKILKLTAADGDGPEMLAPGIPAFTPENPLKEWFDFSLLPPFEQISKYFSFTVLAGNASAEGITFRFYSPVPPELRK